MEIQYHLEIAGTFFFSLTGMMAVNNKDQDWFGAAFISFVTAIGGGSLRDMLLGSYPLVWIGDINFLYAILVGILASNFLFSTLLKLRKTMLVFDTLGIALFTILGTEKALRLEVRPEIAAIMGMFTAVMGGVIRDTLTNEVPVIFRREIYASACLIGAACYLACRYLQLPGHYNSFISIGLIVLIRFLAVKYEWHLPRFLKQG